MQKRCSDTFPARVRAGDQKLLPESVKLMRADFTDRSTPTGAAFQTPPMPVGYANSPSFREAVIPAANGHGTARGVAKLFANVKDLVSQEVFQEAISTQVYGEDRVLRGTTHFGLGVMLFDDETPIGWPGCFGHAGAGGSIGFYDPASDTAFAYVMNQMEDGAVTAGTTASACIEALGACLGQPS